MAGIRAWGGYIPRNRLDRKLIYKSMGWINRGNIGNARGEKAVAGFDEDNITLAVAAGIDCLNGIDHSLVEGVYFASTTMPYRERLNAGIISAALGLRDEVRAADFSGGLKAGTTALLSALEGVESKRVNNMVVCSADCRLGKPGSSQEMLFGDAGSALLVGSEDVVAQFKGSHSVTYDFMDHYRGQSDMFDRQWEERWIKDMGYQAFIPQVIKGLLDKHQLETNDFSKIIYPCIYASERRKINKTLGITEEMDQDTMQAEIGDAGTAQSLLMLVRALEEAEPGDKLMVVSFGSGCDALYFEVTDNIAGNEDRNSISRALREKVALDNYEKYLVWRGILPADRGLRADIDLRTRWSLVWRKRKAVMGLWGSKCKNCGTPQFPPQNICVNPDCGAVNEMDDYCFADRRGRIMSFTGDSLAASLEPPAIYGMIEFDGGGKHMFDITDCSLDALAVGMPVTMSFRRKYFDEKRDIAGYFWKAVPVRGEK